SFAGTSHVCRTRCRYDRRDSPTHCGGQQSVCQSDKTFHDTSLPAAFASRMLQFPTCLDETSCIVRELGRRIESLRPRSTSCPVHPRTAYWSVPLDDQPRQRTRL